MIELMKSSVDFDFDVCGSLSVADMHYHEETLPELFQTLLD